MRQLFRAMREAPDGLPELGRSARMLGVRPGTHPTPDVPAVAATDPVRPNDGGLSVAPDDPTRLPRHRRPASLGGTGIDPVWVLDVADLPAELTARQDTPAHALVEPTVPIPLADFEAAIAGTRVKWKLFTR